MRLIKYVLVAALTAAPAMTNAKVLVATTRENRRILSIEDSAR